MSSSRNKMIAYTQLSNFRSLHGRAFPLVDSGLEEPRGIAFDTEHSKLYVADYGAQSIYRYDVYVQHGYHFNGTTMIRLFVGSDRLTVATNVNVSYIHLDSRHNLYFTDASQNSVNKMPAALVKAIAEGSGQGANLQYVTESVLVSVASTAQSSEMLVSQLTASSSSSGSDSSGTSSSNSGSDGLVFSLYDDTVSSPSVSTPGPVCTSGSSLFWGNTVGGTVNGSVVKGSINPLPPVLLGTSSSLPPFPTQVLSSETANVTGVAATGSMVLWSDAVTGRDLSQLTIACVHALQFGRAQVVTSAFKVPWMGRVFLLLLPQWQCVIPHMHTTRVKQII